MSTELMLSLADQINAEYELCRQAFTASIQHAANAGKLLMQAKEQCEHGEWAAWIKENCKFSERTAQSYMRLARGLPELESNAQALADLSYSSAIALLASPKQIEPPGTDKGNVFDEVYRGIAEYDGLLMQLRTLEAFKNAAKTPQELVAVIRRAERLENAFKEWKLRADQLICDPRMEKWLWVGELTEDEWQEWELMCAEREYELLIEQNRARIGWKLEDDFVNDGKGAKVAA